MRAETRVAKLMQSVARLQGEIDKRFLKMGELLAEVQKLPEPFTSFREACEAYGIHHRKACYLISVYMATTECGLDPNRVLKIGWTKMKTIAPKLGNGRDAYWLKQAETKTVVNLEAALAGKSKSTRTVMAFGLTKAEAAEVGFCLQLTGLAEASTRGLRNKEKALMVLVREFTALRRKKAA
jgi:hypothetical protein